MLSKVLRKEALESREEGARVSVTTVSGGGSVVGVEGAGEGGREEGDTVLGGGGHALGWEQLKQVCGFKLLEH